MKLFRTLDIENYHKEDKLLEKRIDILEKRKKYLEDKKILSLIKAAPLIVANNGWKTLGLDIKANLRRK